MTGVGSAATRTVTWERKYRHEHEASELTDIARTRDGGYAVIGSTYPALDEANTWVVKLDADGAAEWNRAYDDNPDERYDDFGNAVAEVPDGYVVAGRGGESESVRVFRTDRDGDVTASRQFNRTDSSVDGGVDAVAVSEEGVPTGSPCWRAVTRATTATSGCSGWTPSWTSSGNGRTAPRRIWNPPHSCGPPTGGTRSRRPRR